MTRYGSNQVKRLSSVLVSLVLATSPGACSKSTSNSTDNSTGQTVTQASPAPPLTGFEKDLQYVKNGGYTYIWIFSRKDGKPLDKDDGAFLRTNAPQVVDWVTTDEGKKVIGGTNFNLEEGNLAALKKRFVAEDYSGR
jgi:hypothetical protein